MNIRTSWSVAFPDWIASDSVVTRPKSGAPIIVHCPHKLTNYVTICPASTGVTMRGQSHLHRCPVAGNRGKWAFVIAATILPSANMWKYPRSSDGIQTALLCTSFLVVTGQ
jgi:hypothetical protein